MIFNIQLLEFVFIVSKYYQNSTVSFLKDILKSSHPSNKFLHHLVDNSESISNQSIHLSETVLTFELAMKIWCYSQCFLPLLLLSNHLLSSVNYPSISVTPFYCLYSCWSNPIWGSSIKSYCLHFMPSNPSFYYCQTNLYAEIRTNWSSAKKSPVAPY